MKKFLAIILLSLTFASPSFSNDKNKKFQITCTGEQRIKGSVNDHVSFVQDIEIAIGHRGEERFISYYQIIDTDKWMGRPPFYLAPNGLPQKDFNLNVKFNDQEGRINISGTNFKMLKTSNSEVKDYSERINLVTGLLIFNMHVETAESTFLINAKAACPQLPMVYEYLKGGSGNNKGSSSGTAFFVNNKGFLLTNNHVVEGCNLSKISYKNNEYNTKLIATDKTLDLALLKADLKSKTFFTFSKNEPKKLNTIYVAGYPLGKGLSDDLKISSGIVSSLKGFKDNSNEIQIDAPINPGNSGGPVINENGDLIGIAVSGLAKDQTEGINFAIKSSAAETFLRSNKINPKKSMYSGFKDKDELLEILEGGTVYTYCNN